MKVNRIHNPAEKAFIPRVLDNDTYLTDAVFAIPDVKAHAGQRRANVIERRGTYVTDMLRTRSACALTVSYLRGRYNPSSPAGSGLSYKPQFGPAPNTIYEWVSLRG